MTIVVGIDGSVEANRALEWAVSEARRRHMDLTVLHAWYPAVGTDETAAQTVVDEAIELARLLDPTVEVRGRLEERALAAEALVDASWDAELVVVGTEVHFAFASLLLGSVAGACVRRCHCPVVVVPAAARELRTAS